MKSLFFFLSEGTLFLGRSSCVLPEKISPALAELVTQRHFDAHGPSNCISLVCYFSLNSNEKNFSFFFWGLFCTVKGRLP
jgi:hypothetical protein